MGDVRPGPGCCPGRGWLGAGGRARALPRRADPRSDTDRAPGTELSLFWETPELALDHVERFITGVRRIAQPTRLLATVLFTDIVGSTQRWGAGRPALAGAAERARRADRPAGRGVRRPAWSRGPATASWPPSTGPVGRSTVRDLVAGSDVTLEDRGMYLLKGIDGDWQLLAVARP
jgi:hypothetical protein